MGPLFIGDIHSALQQHLGNITRANGYRTDAGLEVETGFAADAEGKYLNGDVSGDSLLIQPGELNRGRQQGTLPLIVFGFTRSADLLRLYELEDDIHRALRDGGFHPQVRGVEFQTVKFGPGESGEFFGVSVPVRILFTHSPF